MSAVERFVERALFAARWLLVPLYLALVVMLALIALHTVSELVHLVPHLFDMSEIDLLVATLSLIDLVLVASLIVMVMLSGFENFVSSAPSDKVEHSLDWLMRLDTGSLKVKSVGTMVAIAAIDLLKALLDVREVATERLVWLIVIELALVVTVLALAFVDRLTGESSR
ncbi:MAG TPA: TIGR00645 family protein [Stellaceae bacterium]|nr:TIGR00645 family protein [Stellaceae bacterium]